jgi:hypothetical protein
MGPLQSLREQLARSSLEEIMLHDYALSVDVATRPRLNLVIPSIAPEKTFGGIFTGIDIFLEIGKRANADLRVLLDEITSPPTRLQMRWRKLAGISKPIRTVAGVENLCAHRFWTRVRSNFWTSLLRI